MASVSVVGQHPGPHRLDSEPLLRAFKPAGGRTKRKSSSWEKMMFRRSGSVGADDGQTLFRAAAAVPAGDTTAARGGILPEGCAASAAPRSPERDGGASAGTRTNDAISDPGTGGRRGASVMRSGAGVKQSATCGHRGARQQSISGGAATEGGGGGCGGRGPPLDRVTQGRTGVVKLARADPPRREAWSIFPQGVEEEEDPRVRTERGEGHRFEVKAVTQDWCDACRRQISAQAAECRNCSYTCHLECESQVQLDCNQRDREPEEAPPPRSHCSKAEHKNEAKEEEGGGNELSEEEVRTRINEYNSHSADNGMKLASDGSFTGFIKVRLRLSRPISVPAIEAAGAEGASWQTAGRSRTPSDGQEDTEKRTSFYLPSDYETQSHITSQTTTTEVIQGLLKKFMVLDNPRKFALFRLTHRDGQDLFQKLPPGERPLVLRLIAGPDPEQLSFVLKENETGDVQWHAFTLPELQNFLVILEKEETERVRAVESKYSSYRQKLEQALRQHDH